MKILLTGATGLVGSALVPLLETDHELLIVSRNPVKARHKFGQNHQYLASLDQLHHLDDVDAVINLAGEPIVAKRWSDQQKEKICHSRWDITDKIAQLINASSTPPHTLLSASAIGFYGRQGEARLAEDAVPHQEFSHHICNVWEQKAQAAASNYTRVCIFRIGVVLAAHGGALAKMLPAFKLGLGGPIGDGKQGMSWIHLRDLLALICYLLNNPECEGVYNATAPNPVTNADFAKALGKALHRPACLPAPAFILKLALGEMADLLIEGQFIVPKHALDEGFYFEFAEINEALADLFPD
ncbi:TIGR01777 family oxidoreductase [Shewanella sp. C32]|uniref:TIGR01777 family oxidoreductase n=1 Tax=Shewanella electrica TaxID=515560 RepID=A0ABT2FH30_9GAMM|nr:TIGR01777 family oxidoreductase [Shewanella electrica]MCH1923545.1 TIGR01777 family oxidoreductase [Shewanella electrica]MCS4555642.1 TIGR01777 family oxidoreductase [Shewanella electrica]